MMGQRRFSQAISEGDGISLIAPVSEADVASAAERAGAEGVILDVNIPKLAGRDGAADSVATPRIAGRGADGAERMPCCSRPLLSARTQSTSSADGRRRTTSASSASSRCATRTSSSSPSSGSTPRSSCSRRARPATPTIRSRSVLDLLPDIPAGKLAIADVEVTTLDEIAELERAGVDAVIVASHNLAGLVRAAPPEV